MRWRSFLLTIVLNAFLMLFVSVILEYTNLTDRFISLEDVVSLATDAALSSSTGSEEMFSDRFTAIMSSKATVMDGKKDELYNTSSSSLVYSSEDNEFKSVNIYKLAGLYADSSGKFAEFMKKIKDDTTINAKFTDKLVNGQVDETRAIFEWLYGGVASSYGSTNGNWVNASVSKQQELDNAQIGATKPDEARSATAEFKNFYEEIGHMQKTYGYLKKKGSSGDKYSKYNLSLTEYPTLLNMGFSNLDAESNGYNKQGTMSKTHDNFLSSAHIGKSFFTESSRSKFNLDNTVYYLTPMSLGVTYIPTKVFKAAVVNNINTYSKLRGIGGASTSGKKFADDGGNIFKQFTGCIKTNVYSGASTTPEEHIVDSDEYIVNDGLVEYDLDSIKVKIDYYFKDFTDKGDANNATIISGLNGQISEASDKKYASSKVDYPNADQTDLRKKTLAGFIDQDTATHVQKIDIHNGSGDENTDFSAKYNSVKNQRIVAKVTVKVKVHIPYKSAVLQWFCKRFQSNSSHYGIKLYDSDSGEIDSDDDSVWYTYSTYFMQSRV